MTCIKVGAQLKFKGGHPHRLVTNQRTKQALCAKRPSSSAVQTSRETSAHALLLLPSPRFPLEPLTLQQSKHTPLVLYKRPRTQVIDFHHSALFLLHWLHLLPI